MSTVFIPRADPMALLHQGIAVYEVLAEHTGEDARDAHDGALRLLRQARDALEGVTPSAPTTPANKPDFTRLADLLSAALDAARAVRVVCSQIEEEAQGERNEHRQGLAHAASLAADDVDRAVLPVFDALSELRDSAAAKGGAA